jgi:hypothetical protein
VVRALQTEPVGPFAAVKSLRFGREYPIANYDFNDPVLPAKVSMETFSPFVPMIELPERVTVTEGLAIVVSLG